MIHSQVKIVSNLKVHRRRVRQVRRKGSTSCINQQLIQTELQLSQQYGCGHCQVESSQSHQSGAKVDSQLQSPYLGSRSVTEVYKVGLCL